MKPLIHCSSSSFSLLPLFYKWFVIIATIICHTSKNIHNLFHNYSLMAITLEDGKIHKFYNLKGFNKSQKIMKIKAELRFPEPKFMLRLNHATKSTCPFHVSNQITFILIKS